MRIRLLSILIIFCLSTGLSYAIDKGSIVGVWFFNEGDGNVVEDATGNGHDGEIAGDVKWDEGKFDKGLSFPGTAGSYVSVPHDDDLTLATFSITAWVKFGSTGSTQRILIKGSASSSYSYYLSTRGDQVFAYSGFSTTGMGGWVEAMGVKEVTDEQWHHVATTYDGEVLRLYVDGDLETETGGGGEPFPNEDPVAIGTESDGNYPALGVIDDVGLFDAALTEGDIGKIMTVGIAKTTGLAPVFPAGKLPVVWGEIKLSK